MKKLVLSAVLVLSLVSISPTLTDARPAPCDVALQNCAERCASFWLGIKVAVDGCVGGCFLGYLFC